MRVQFSTSVGATLRGTLSRMVERLGGAVADDVASFTHFVTLAPTKGDAKTGFRKSIAALLALAAGAPRILNPTSLRPSVSAGCRS